MTELKSPGGFAPVMTECERELMLKRDVIKLLIVRAAAHHCDEYGIAWPGDKLLGAVVGCRPEKVAEELYELQRMGWIKLHVEYNRRTRQEERLIQFSPNVIWIREELRANAWHAWNNQGVIANLSFDPQPDSESESESDSVNQNQQQQQNQTQTTKPSYEVSGSGSQKPDPLPPQPGQQQQTFLPDGKNALIDFDDERYAHKLAQRYNMTKPQARALIQTYGRQRVEQTSQTVSSRIESGSAKNPGGLLVAILRDGGVEKADTSPQSYARYAANERMFNS